MLDILSWSGASVGTETEIMFQISDISKELLICEKVIDIN